MMFSDGPRRKHFRIEVRGEQKRVPVSEKTFFNLDNLFFKESPSKLQKGRYYTLRDCSSASYEYGYENGYDEGYRKGLEDAAKPRPQPPQR